MKKYQIIYADPPWNSNSQFGRDKKRGNEQHYPLMTLEDTKNLPVIGGGNYCRPASRIGNPASVGM